MKLKYLFIFTVTLLIGLTIGYLFSIRTPHPIAKNPIPLDFTIENQGTRCRDGGHWDGPSEGRLCYELQEKLSEAVINNDLDGIRKALRLGASPNGSYYQSFKPLFSAAMGGRKEAAVLLIENGAEVDSKDIWNTTSLQTAVYYRHNELVELLLENGADVCHRANWGEFNFDNPNALDIARKYGNKDAERLLIDFGARRCVLSREGLSSLAKYLKQL